MVRGYNKKINLEFLFGSFLKKFFKKDMELHSYDRIINFKVEEEILLLDKEFKKEKVLNYVTLITDKISPESRFFLSGIVNDIERFDEINQVFILDLMYICTNFGTEDFLSEFDIQLRDMQTGFCEQGRSIRLIQLLRAFS